jgi:hypothetical protein
LTLDVTGRAFNPSADGARDFGHPELDLGVTIHAEQYASRGFAHQFCPTSRKSARDAKSFCRAVEMMERQNPHARAIAADLTCSAHQLDESLLTALNLARHVGPA